MNLETQIKYVVAGVFALLVIGYLIGMANYESPETRRTRENTERLREKYGND